MPETANVALPFVRVADSTAKWIVNPAFSPAAEGKQKPERRCFANAGSELYVGVGGMRMPSGPI
jgi:hypothetical protein